MILLVNVFITKKRESAYDRGILHEDDPLDIFRFFLASLSGITYSRAYILAELDPDLYGSREIFSLELEIARSIKVKDRAVNFSPKRLYSLADWRAFFRREIEHCDDLIMYCGNHDHVYMDYGNDVFDACVNELERLKVDVPFSSMIYSHWPSYFSYRPVVLDWCREYFITETVYRDSTQILTRDLLWKWIFEDSTHLPDDHVVRRMEELGWSAPRPFLQIVPNRQLFYHYDCDAHSGTPITQYPPLQIPQGFFDGSLRIACLRGAPPSVCREFNEKGFLTLDPCSDATRAVQESGPYFWWDRSDIPRFLLDRACEVVEIEECDPQYALFARDQKICRSFGNRLSVDVPTLARLAPVAVKSSVKPGAVGCCDRSVAYSRHSRWSWQKYPLGDRKLRVVYIEPECQHALNNPAAGTLLSQLAAADVGVICIKIRHAREAAWIVGYPGYALGRSFAQVDGIAVSNFDYYSDSFEVACAIIANVRADSLLFIEPATEHEGLALLEQVALRVVALNKAIDEDRVVGFPALVQDGLGRHRLVGLRKSRWDALVARNPGVLCTAPLGLCDAVLELAGEGAEEWEAGAEVLPSPLVLHQVAANPGKHFARQIKAASGRGARSAVIHGAGPSGRLAAVVAQQHNIRILAFADGNKDLYGHVIDGLPVLSHVEACQLGADVAIVGSIGDVRSLRAILFRLYGGDTPILDVWGLSGVQGGLQ